MSRAEFMQLFGLQLKNSKERERERQSRAGGDMDVKNPIMAY